MDVLKKMSKTSEEPRGESKNMKSLMRFNDLIFEEIANPSLISQRNMQRFNSQSINYTSESSSIDFVFQTGDTLLDPENSYL